MLLAALTRSDRLSPVVSPLQLLDDLSGVLLGQLRGFATVQPSQTAKLSVPDHPLARHGAFPPAAADKLVKYLRALFEWAVKNKHATVNPAVGVEKIHETEGWHTWAPAEVEVYREHHAIGTKARLALARIGRQHELEGRLRFFAWKGRGNRKTRRTIDVPISADLAVALATLLREMTYLVTELGSPFTINGLGNKMRDWCDAAALNHCSAHGLRKAAAVALAESGVTAPELCAVFAWGKLETAEIYIREANASRMSSNAFARLDEYRNRKNVSLSGSRTTNETKRKKIVRNQSPNSEMVGPAGLEPATRPL